MCLSLENLSAAYDGYPVFQGYNLQLQPAKAIGIVGLNGVGKSTLLKAIMSLTPKKRGKVLFFGRDVTHHPTHELIRLGLTLIPEGRQVFTKMTVRENLEIGAYAAGTRTAVKQQLQRVIDFIPSIGYRQKQLAGSLSGGEQQMLVIARGLMSAPKILLIDEPFLGLAPGSIETVRASLSEIKNSGMGLLIAEEDQRLLDGVVDQVFSFNGGGS